MNTEQERADFEAWLRVKPCGAAHDFAWEAWRARAALQSQDREDAERYRWLRNRAIAEGICVVHIDYWSEEYRGLAHCEVYDGESLDKAIDHARRAEGDGE